MMFVFTILFMFALGAVLYLMVRALPRVAPDPQAKESFLDRWARSEIPEKIDAAFNGFLVKFLRRVKIFAMKFDNAVSAGLRRAAAEEKEKDKKHTFELKDITESVGDGGEKKNNGTEQ
jgi:Na+-transporting methylmalonyl-CoA/oxaloacetate decarboxylase gamma subunit